DSCTRNKEHALTLSWERIPRLASGVRVKQSLLNLPQLSNNSAIFAHTVVQALKSLDFRYHRILHTENLHPELPGPGDHIVDFSEGKIDSPFATVGDRCIERWNSFSKRPGKNTPQCYTKPLDSLKKWNNRFFWVDEKVFPTVVAWRTAATKDDKPQANTYSMVDVAILDTHQMDLFNLIKASNPTKGVDTGVHGSVTAKQEIPVIDDAGATGVTVEPNLEKEIISMLSEMSVDTGLAIHTQKTHEPHVTTQTVNDPDPLSYAKPWSQQEVTQSSKEK
ncbi:hypothetical protein Tco_1415076, partial [Tanacetum coccineum]